MSKVQCQYWVIDEPVVCRYWDAASILCTYRSYDGTQEIVADNAPYCNLIGTSYYTCDQYTTPEGSESSTRSRCVLPDPSRQGQRHSDCELWVSTVGSGWLFDAINGYNNGDCDGKGTTVTCSGYSPYSLGFGPLKPKQLADTDLSDLLDPAQFNLPNCVTASGLGFRDPMSLSLFNLRAKLGKCRWWDSPSTDFTIDSSDGSINDIQSFCINTDEKVKPFHKYQLTDYSGYIAPCNGAKPECPGYCSNICWQYIIDKLTSEGSKILAEQILELRYYIKKERWSDVEKITQPVAIDPIYKSYYYNYFLEPDLYSWQGTLTLDVKEDKSVSAIIPAIKNYLNQFYFFEVTYETLSLTAGIPTRNQPSYFPTLIRELPNTQLSPIIRTVFDTEVSNINSGIDVIFSPKKVFETDNIDHKYLTIWGDCFYDNSIIIAINASDPELKNLHSIFEQLDLFKNMDELRRSLSADSFTRFYNKLDIILNRLIKYRPDKVFYSKLEVNQHAFFIDTETFFGENNIFVFDSTDSTSNQSSTWEYDKITVNKTFIGAVIGQTSFMAKGDGGTIDRLPDYRRGFNAIINKNCQVGFSIFFLRNDSFSSKIAYIYNDTLVDGTYCFHKYKVTVFENLVLDIMDVKFIGNQGLAVVIIPDPECKLHNTNGKWGIEGDITLDFIDSEGKLKSIKMEQYPTTSESIEINQIVLRPVNKEDFRSPCSFELHLGKSIYTYEKRSFGQLPHYKYEELTDKNNVLVKTGELEVNDNKVTISNFPDEAILASVAYTTSAGRIKGLTRSKLLVWVRQPYCRDFEIFYNWTMSYTKWALEPRAFCFYSDTNAVIVNTTTKYTDSWSPSCGDHDKSSIAKSAAMWYPYGQCAQYERNNELSSAHANVLGIMSVFVNKDGSLNTNYGNWNLRMCGPPENKGMEESHASIWECGCDYFYYNYIKSSDNIFSGYARYRGGLSSYDYEICMRYDGTPPKFGNVYRDQLNSYRSIDRVRYDKKSGTQYINDYRWMPVSEYFTSSNLFGPCNVVGEELYTDDYNSPYYTQLGVLLVSDSIEGVVIKETIDDKLRLRFSEVFDTNLSISLQYPQTRPRFIYDNNGHLTDIVTWYTYKALSDDSKSIQWAWREDWLSIERAQKDKFYRDMLLHDNIDNVLTYKTLVFLTIEYPEYLYDAKQNELCQVIEEGTNFINFVVSKIEGKPTEKNIEPLFLLQLNSKGPPRVFNLDGDWVSADDIPDTVKFDGYTIDDVKKGCLVYTDTNITGNEWVSESTLYTESVIQNSADAKANGQWLFMYDGDGKYYEQYFKRGLIVKPDIAMFDFLPKKYSTLEAIEYELAFNHRPTLCKDCVLSNLVPGEYFPASIVLDGAEYLDSTPKLLTITLDFSKDNSVYRPKLISMVELKFKFTLDTDKMLAYSIPAIKLYGLSAMSDDFDLVATYPKKTASISNTTNTDYELCKISLQIDYLSFKHPYKMLKLVFDNTLDSAVDLKKERGDEWQSFSNRIKLIEVVITEVSLESVTESINTYERMYHVSTGNYGDLPPEGDNSTGKILHPPINEQSTAYHRDTSVGILGANDSGKRITLMNKCRGRILQECHIDKEYYKGIDVHELEKEQKRIYDSVVRSGVNKFVMRSVIPPGLKTKLAALGITYPTWNCVFENSTVGLLSPIVPQHNFNDLGHKWSYDVEVPVRTYCGKGIYGDVFHFQYIDVATGEDYLGYGWMGAQYQAAINRFKYSDWLFAGFFSSVNYTPHTITYETGGKSTIDESNITKLIF